MPMKAQRESMYYGFAVNDVHFVAMDTESPLDFAAMTQIQLNFLSEYVLIYIFSNHP